MGKGDYPDNWEEVAFQIKQAAGWKCERCNHPHNPQNGYTLTVHHLDGNPVNLNKLNLVALCQRCHLHVQNVPLPALFSQLELFDPFETNWLDSHRNETMKGGPSCQRSQSNHLTKA